MRAAGDDRNAWVQQVQQAQPWERSVRASDVDF
jgi:hypothetical protein